MPNTIPGISRFPQGVLLNQHRIEEVLLSSLARFPQVEIQCGLMPISIEYDCLRAHDEAAHPITVKFRPLNGEEPVLPPSVPVDKEVQIPHDQIPKGEVSNGKIPDGTIPNGHNEFSHGEKDEMTSHETVLI